MSLNNNDSNNNSTNKKNERRLPSNVSHLRMLFRQRRLKQRQLRTKQRPLQRLFGSHLQMLFWSSRRPKQRQLRRQLLPRSSCVNKFFITSCCMPSIQRAQDCLRKPLRCGLRPSPAELGSLLLVLSQAFYSQQIHRGVRFVTSSRDFLDCETKKKSAQNCNLSTSTHSSRDLIFIQYVCRV